MRTPSSPRSRLEHAAGQQQAQVLLGAQHRPRRSSAPGAITTSVKIRAISLGGRLIERPVAGDDAAEGAQRIAGQRLAVGLAPGRADGHAARVGVLDDRDRRARQLGHQREARHRYRAGC